MPINHSWHPVDKYDADIPHRSPACLTKPRFHRRELWQNRSFSSTNWCKFPLSSFNSMFSIPDCEAVRFSGPAVLITVDDGNNEHIRLLSCLRYASVPVSNNDSLVVNSFDFALISLAVIRDFQGRSHVNLRFQLKWLGEWNLNYKKNGICVTPHPSRNNL